MNRVIRTRGFSTESFKRVQLDAKFDNGGNLLNPRSVASSSLFGWGKWQTSSKVTTKYGPAWWVTTAGHGGYILVAEKEHPEFIIDPALTIAADPMFKGKLLFQACRACVYEFEEDCDWAILEYLDSRVRDWSMTRHGCTDLRWYTEMIEKTLKAYRPDVLAAKSTVALPR